MKRKSDVHVDRTTLHLINFLYKSGMKIVNIGRQLDLNRDTVRRHIYGALMIKRRRKQNEDLRTVFKNSGINRTGKAGVKKITVRMLKAMAETEVERALRLALANRKLSYVFRKKGVKT